MKTYSVSVPITGIAFIEVEAEDQSSAIDRALSEVTIDNIEEWSPHEQIVEGNVFHGMRNEAEAEEIED